MSVMKSGNPAGATPGGSAQERRPSLKVLVIEDDFGDFDAVVRALRRIDSYDITTMRARTIREARHLAATETFHVAFVDFNLGLDTGLHFLRENGGRIGGMLTILLSGSTSPDVQRAALEAGAIACINKADISATLLESTIRSGQHTHSLERQLHTVLTALEHSKQQATVKADDEAGPARRLVNSAEELMRAVKARKGHLASEIEDLQSILSAARRLSNLQAVTGP